MTSVTIRNLTATIAKAAKRIGLNCNMVWSAALQFKHRKTSGESVDKSSTLRLQTGQVGIFRNPNDKLLYERLKNGRTTPVGKSANHAVGLDNSCLSLIAWGVGCSGVCLWTNAATT